MLRSYLFKGVLIGLFLLGSSTLYAQAATPKKLFWYQHPFHMDAGTMLFLSKNNNKEKNGAGRTDIELHWAPVFLVDTGWRWTGTLGRCLFGQADLYFRPTNAILMGGDLALALLPYTRFSLGYIASKDILFTLGLGTKEFFEVHGILALDMPFSDHLYLTVEAAHPFDRYNMNLLRITAKLGYKF
ncbi:MAG: hypothetical protein AAF963_00935 [Bacteroidota bacterium]